MVFHFGVPEDVSGYVSGGLSGYVNVSGYVSGGHVNGGILGGRFGAGLGGLLGAPFSLQIGHRNLDAKWRPRCCRQVFFFGPVARSGVLNFWCQTNGAGASAEPTTAT